MKIGMRNIKTAISVIICLVIYRLFNLGSPFFAVVAAIIAMQSSVKDSFKAGKDRMLGTFLGAIIGLLFALINPESIILVGLGIVIIIYISNRLNWNNSISIAAVVFISIMISLENKSPVEYSLLRLLDTFAGIIVAVLVNHFIIPPKSLSRIIYNSRQVVEKIKLLVGETMSHEAVKTDELLNSIKSLLNNIEYSLDEIRMSKTNSNLGRTIREVVSLADRINKSLDIIFIMKDTAILNPQNAENLRTIFNTEPDLREYVKDEDNIVYNYHVKKIFEDIAELDRLIARL